MGSEESAPTNEPPKDTSLDEWSQNFLLNSEVVLIPLEESILYCLNAPWLMLVCYI